MLGGVALERVLDLLRAVQAQHITAAGEGLWRQDARTAAENLERPVRLDAVLGLMQPGVDGIEVVLADVLGRINPEAGDAVADQLVQVGGQRRLYLVGLGPKILQSRPGCT